MDTTAFTFTSGLPVFHRPIQSGRPTSVRRDASTPWCASASGVSGDGLSRRVFLAAAAATCAAVLSPNSARADRTAVAAKRAYDRYYPRIKAGAGDLHAAGELLRAGKRDECAALLSSKLFTVKFRNALTIYATSFSDNYVAPRSQALLNCVNTFYKQIDLVLASGEGEDPMEHFGYAQMALKSYVNIARLPKDTVDMVEI